MIERQSFESKSIEDLSAIADVFLKKYSSGIFLLKGEMGVGKTTLVKAICKALGLKDTSSPTFSLVNHYLGDKTSVYHFDLYRLKSLEEALDVGFEEYLEKQGYLFIEWPDVIEPLLPAGFVTISILDNEAHRIISF